MTQELWQLFEETGDPMGYLLYRAYDRHRQAQACQSAETPREAEPPPPVTAS